MTAVTTKDFDTLVSDFAAAAQASSTTALDFSEGSVLLADADATAGVALWLQANILRILTLSRASTCSGVDLDSWMADYSFSREAATAATGSVTFSRLSATAAAIVPVGAVVETADASQTYAVTADSGNAAWSADIVSGGGYVLPVGVSSLTVPVAALAAGTGGNVVAGAISTISGSISGIDTVSNAAALTNGLAAETDAAFLARFALYIAGLSRGTLAAISGAIAGVQQGLVQQLQENADYTGATDYGYFYAVVDDGSGAPSAGLLAAVGSAVEATRGFGIRYGIFAPVVVTASVAMTIATASGYVHATVAAAVQAALQAAINALGLGVSLPFTQLAAIAYGVPGVVNVTGVTLNGSAADLAASVRQVIRAGAIEVA